MPAGRCEECGRERKWLHKHHVVPRANGGRDEDGLRQLCANCHEDVHDGPWGGTLARLNAYSPEANAKRSASVKKALADPEVRARLSERSKQTWQDEEVAAKRMAGLKRHYEENAEDVAARNRRVAANNKARQAAKNAERNAAIAEMRRSHGLRETADAFGLSIATVSQISRDAGVGGYRAPQKPEAIARGAASRRAANAERNKRILELVAEGKTQPEIAAQLGMKRGAVSQVITRERKRGNFKGGRPVHSPTAVHDEEIARLKAEGLSDSEIGRRVGVSGPTVARSLARSAESS